MKARGSFVIGARSIFGALEASEVVGDSIAMNATVEPQTNLVYAAISRG